MSKRHPIIPTTPGPSGEAVPTAPTAQHSQAEIDNRAWKLYSERYKVQPKEMNSQCREAMRFYAECLKQASEEMGPPIDFRADAVIIPAVVAPEVQALIDRMALLRGSPLERLQKGFLRG